MSDSWLVSIFPTHLWETSAQRAGVVRRFPCATKNGSKRRCRVGICPGVGAAHVFVGPVIFAPAAPTALLGLRLYRPLAFRHTLRPWNFLGRDFFSEPVCFLYGEYPLSGSPLARTNCKVFGALVTFPSASALGLLPRRVLEAC